MGWHVGWIGVRGMDRDRILDAAGLVEAPPERAAKAKLKMWALPNGWTVLFAEEFGFPTPERMAALSAGGTAIALSADETVMVSVVRGYERGKAVFAIEHDGGQQGVRHMKVLGAAPAEWQAILARLTKRQDKEDEGEAEVDHLFDAQVELAQALCGYQHDKSWPKGKMPTTTLLMKRKSPGLIGRLFGRG